MYLLPIIFILFNLMKNVFPLINSTEYYKMPKLFIFDDYDRCLSEFNNKSTYCVAKTIIKPNKTSNLWNYIEQFSSDKIHHYRHDRLVRGVCISSCKKLLSYNDYDTQMKYYLKKFNYTTEVTLDPWVYRNNYDDQIKYNKIINQCINYELKRKYELMGYSQVEYCIESDYKYQPDKLDNTFLIIFILLIVVIIISTIYDHKLLKKSKDVNFKEYYKTPACNNVTNLLTCFSLKRNFYRLLSNSKTKLSKDLHCIQTIRFLTMFLVIMGHTVLFYSVVPIANTIYVENLFYDPFMFLLLNGSTIIQTYFTISGFLLAAHFLTLKEKKFKYSYYWKILFHRYIRLTPALVFLIGLHATWLEALPNGPVSPYSILIEKHFCRKNFWSNLLYINNYVNTEEHCFQHGWYLAAEFQLFAFCLLILMITWRFPKITKVLFAVVLFISCLIPAIVIYINKFPGIFMILPEQLKYLLWYDEMYTKFYIPSHTNISCYFVGVIFGIFYYKLKEYKINLNNYKSFVISWCLTVPIGLLLLYSGSIFYNYEFIMPAVWISMYGALFKKLWGVLVGTLILGCAFNTGGFIRDFLCHPLFRPLGRITYCTYLCHTFVIRMSVGAVVEPMHNTIITTIVSSFSNFVISCFMGLILTLIIEFPLTALMKIMVPNTEVEQDLTENIGLKIPMMDVNADNIRNNNNNSTSTI